MSDQITLDGYKELVKKHLDILTPIFAKASIGDFTSTLEIPDDSEEFVQLYAGIQIMLEVIRDQLAQLNRENQIKTEFLMLAAHQLRTPLTTMRWNIEAILASKQGLVSDELRRNMERLHSGNLKMINLINDLLNITRIEEQKHEEQFRVVDPVETINQIIKEQDPLIKRKKISVKVLPENTTMPKVMTSPKYFYETVLNLLVNAVKYNKPNGQVIIKIEERALRLLITVQDTGIGIPDNEKDRIFTQFFRGQKATQQEAEGTGLGLFLVKSFIDRFGGKIWFESKEGVGSTFFVDLPIIAKPQEISETLDK
ncbi:hypothetical protein A3G67_03830 [Candidatus Roizmanbacteria bacterium RIFCSPLOWO2_12_FULL_40_12]|uniref:histidine kinase n=1 Tax=Candidatus Roizmanbacteria bacterium RIFCSPLOWO2_01_FULL_40_42 TaxID=1802066 RepID=A0A1F7J5R0_9BACT|nr:MAG: hypothetical protein A2779_03465 [Candidatus Roizmanbacteria bacterium RIFCSPHIGHO2_01_FULL_40_98]OGK28394.1 MAG: hypothetical protein A3C31_00830 [Candidatus Roizmanbacteria bacterium RIFCSPHIGHO2_02_FULL_40_53]OGK30630.1 MAG: hypothetical protein A2W49_03515 [Candidatus Roizmanbacteria bacterium RIFCSPHIGHO2_12_41_18]OGK35958.1 MAG: hypothetical protein A3E69_03200 [Candidatus Roizmanbacteria bacterium RIFCSPHIGHO2_12_FULL_40_130]OGK50950.1 MAG: hypothetical protein A3B50_01600 [Candi